MSHVSLVAEMDRLLGDFCSGTLDQQGFERLESLLERDESARCVYNNYLFLHAELYAQHADPALLTSDDALVALSGPGTLFDGRRPRRTFSLAVAVALIGVAAVSSWVTLTLARRTGPEQARATIGAPGGESLDQSQPAVARITATRDCRWDAPSVAIGFGSRLRAGQRLNLAAGLAEITFSDGAKVVMEGPASFDVFAPGQATLHEGRIAASVPERARGFTVAAAGLSVVDLGTEFGMMAKAEGETEVHVFNGLVEAFLLDAEGRQIQKVELNAAEAARIRPASYSVAKIPARRDDFVRSLSAATGPHDGLFAFDDFNYPAGPLAAQNGGFGWGEPWFNLAAAGNPEDNSNGVVVGSLDCEGVVPSGNRAVQSGQENRIRRVLSTSIGGVFDAAGLVENQDGVRLVGRDGTTVYLSFLQRVDRLSDVFYGFELHRGDGNPNRVLCIGHGAEGTGYGVTSNANVYGPANFPALGPENTQTNFFVVRITFGEGNRDRVEVFRNPESLVDEDACRVDAELVGNFAFDRVGFANFHGTKVHEIDEIRVGTSFPAVSGRRSRGSDGLLRRVAMWDELKLPPVADAAATVRADRLTEGDSLFSM